MFLSLPLRPPDQGPTLNFNEQTQFHNMKIKAPVFGMDRLKLTFKTNRQILKFFPKCCLSLEIFLLRLRQWSGFGFGFRFFFSCKPKIIFTIHALAP
ncbi:hypothetical protein AB237_1059 [Acinetobacter baumannii NCGM 237]|nr:hypothetical protein AB237_1059 [Acinetobacter baumannii NCGM 237]